MLVVEGAHLRRRDTAYAAPAAAMRAATAMLPRTQLAITAR